MISPAIGEAILRYENLKTVSQTPYYVSSLRGGYAEIQEVKDSQSPFHIKSPAFRETIR